MNNKTICRSCGHRFKTENRICPKCGAYNSASKSEASSPVQSAKSISTPKTIGELEQFCSSKGMPLEKMRFFIGTDYRQPKAFGIYQDDKTGSFVVYKNKDDGTRAIRYEGTDEAFAVSELYQKLLDECHLRGIYPDGMPQKPINIKRKPHGTAITIGVTMAAMGCIIFLCELAEKNEDLAIFFTLWIIFSFIAGLISIDAHTKHPDRLLGIKLSGASPEAVKKKKAVGMLIVSLIIGAVLSAALLAPQTLHPKGYYRYNNELYYRISYTYYRYDTETEDWQKANIAPIDREYFIGEEYWGVSNKLRISYSDRFENSNYYQDYSSGSSDSAYSSWDSGSTDWSSDW